MTNIISQIYKQFFGRKIDNGYKFAGDETWMVNNGMIKHIEPY